MVIYLDLIFLLNLGFDFLILLVVDLTLKRKAKFYRLILASLFGSLSIFILFFNISSFVLFILKIMASSIMLFIAFGYKNIKYFLINGLYLWTTSILLGGFLYYLNLKFSYKNEGLIFFFDGFSINYIFLLIFCPIILYIYIKQNKKIKNNYHHYYKVKLTLSNNQVLNLMGIIDTGNRLKDPVSNKNIILINKSLIKDEKLLATPLLVPYKVVNHHSILKCIKLPKLEIENLIVKENLLLGLMNEKPSLDGIDVILNYNLWEELYD